MSSKTKIIVLHLKELIYTGILALLALLFLLLLLFMFLPKKENETASLSGQEVRFLPGKYTTCLQIGSSSADVEVVVDASCITSIRLVNLTEVITTMYPLMEPCMDSISKQILDTQSLENITYPEENKYTSTLLLDAIYATLQKAQLPDTP